MAANRTIEMMERTILIEQQGFDDMDKKLGLTDAEDEEPSKAPGDPWIRISVAIETQK